MVNLIYPSSIELTEIATDLVARLQENRPIFNLFPMVDVDSHIIAWDQQDNYFGLQQLRGLNNKPTRVKDVGGKRYVMEPGVYGEYAMIDEQELVSRRAYGTFTGNLDVTDLVRRRQDQLLVRRLDRIEYIIWTLLVNGTFSISTPDGVVAHTDTYTFQTATAAVPWGTVATATPVQDFRAIQLLARGHGVNFGGRAQAWMNLPTANKLLGNQNDADLHGYRVNLSVLENLAAINNVLAANDLPQIVVYDEGYYDDANAFQTFIPNDKVIVIGARRDGSPIGQYSMTRNANNPGMAPGPYMLVVDNVGESVPRTLEVHDGHNGGPELHYPSAVVVLSVG